MKNKQVIDKSSFSKRVFELIQYIRSLQLNHVGIIDMEKLKSNIDRIYMLREMIFSSEQDYIYKECMYTVYTDWGGKHCIINPMLNEFITINGTNIQYNNLYDISSKRAVHERSMTDCKELSINLDIKYSSMLNCLYQLLVVE